MRPRSHSVPPATGAAGPARPAGAPLRGKEHPEHTHGPGAEVPRLELLLERVPAAPALQKAQDGPVPSCLRCPGFSWCFPQGLQPTKPRMAPNKSLLTDLSLSGH